MANNTVNFQSDEDDDGEWGFCVQLEQESEDNTDSHGSYYLLGHTASPKTGMKISVKQTVTRGLSTSDSETSLAAPTFPRIKSNSSFQELERAIGATLAMSFPEPDALNKNTADISAHVKVINHINGVINQKATLKKNLQQQRPIMRHRESESHKKEAGKDEEYPMRAELLPFLEENESRALIIFHSRDIIAFDIKSACQMFGSLYYFRSDFHSCGLTLLAYFDLRSAIDAKEKLSARLGRLAKATVFSSIMLQPSTSCHECSLRIYRVLNTKSEALVQKIFSNYGPLRSIQRSFNDSGVKGTLTETPDSDSTCDYTAEYYNIQDAKLAQAEMTSSAHNVLGAEVVFVPLEKRLERLKKALLSTLSTWRIRMAHDDSVATGSGIGGTEGNQREVKPEKLPIPPGNLDDLGSYEDGGVGSAKSSSSSIKSSGVLENASSPPLSPSVEVKSQTSSPELQTSDKSNKSKVKASTEGTGTSSTSNVLGYAEPLRSADVNSHRVQQQVPVYSQYDHGMDNNQYLQHQQQPVFTYHSSPLDFHPQGFVPPPAPDPNMHQHQQHLMALNGFVPYYDQHHHSAALPIPNPMPQYHMTHPAHPHTQHHQYLSNMYGGGGRGIHPPQMLHPSMHHTGAYDSGGYAIASELGDPSSHNQHVSMRIPYKKNGQSKNINKGGHSKPPHHNGGHSKRNMNARNSVEHHGNHSSEENNLPLTPQHLMNGSENRTTVMIRNIPNKYSQSMLLEEINQNYEGQYDFFYLPIDFKNKCNVGYAFINFVDSRDVARFFDEFNDQRWRNFNSEKVCALSYARIQGKAAMIARFQNSSLLLKDDSYKPLLFVSRGEHKGQPEPFMSTYST